MRKGGKLIFCMLQKNNLCFMLNQRSGTPVKPTDFEGVRLYWTPTDVHKLESGCRASDTTFQNSNLETRTRQNSSSRWRWFSHWFGVATAK